MVGPLSLHISENCVVSPVSKNMKKFMIHDKQSVVPPFFIQQVRVKVDNFNGQLPRWFNIPTGDTVTLGGAGPQNTQPYTNQRREVDRTKERDLRHAFKNLTSQALKEGQLLVVRLDHLHPS